MLSYTNYMAVNTNCYAVAPNHDSDTEPPLKEKISRLIYPAIGVAGIVYQLYLVLSR